jgi:hypothetical protein
VKIEEIDAAADQNEEELCYHFVRVQYSKNFAELVLTTPRTVTPNGRIELMNTLFAMVAISQYVVIKSTKVP